MRLLTLFLLVCALAVAAAPAHAGDVRRLVIENAVTIGPPPDFFATGPFTATGPVCPSGQSADLSRVVLRSVPDVVDLFITKRFTCDDGSGTFDIALVVHLVFSTHSNHFIWAVIGGTGSYDDLSGFGQGSGGQRGDTYTGFASLDD